MDQGFKQMTLRLMATEMAELDKWVRTVKRGKQSQSRVSRQSVVAGWVRTNLNRGAER